MRSKISLCELSCGTAATVCDIDKRSHLYNRFKELGMIEGTEVKKVMISPLGDPSAYLVRGTLIALRKSDADAVKVTVGGDAE